MICACANLAPLNVLRPRIFREPSALCPIRMACDLTSAPSASSNVDEQANLDLLVQSAQTRVERQLSDADATDAKALGLLALGAAAIALLVATHDTINRFWWLPVIGFSVASALFLLAARPREFDVGPDLTWLYDRWTAARTSAADAARQMLSECLSSLGNNYALSVRKGLYVRLGLIALVLSALGSIPVALIRPGS